MAKNKVIRNFGGWKSKNFLETGIIASEGWTSLERLTMMHLCITQWTPLINGCA